jgi:hypothetical protein
MATGANIFVLAMGPENAANLLEQAYHLGMLHSGTQVFATLSAMSSGNVDVDVGVDGSST